MRKLIESTLVSIDGVIEAPERWAIFDEEATQRSMQELDNYDAFVMGRVTYERFRDNWGAGGNPYIDRISAMPKYVASRTRDGPPPAQPGRVVSLRASRTLGRDRSRDPLLGSLVVGSGVRAKKRRVRACVIRRPRGSPLRDQGS
jgi:dihydrofolate reductase